MRVLAARGYTQKQIARELRVSVRTVKRDWDKVRSYAKADVKRRLRREFERRYPGLGFDEAAARLKHDVKVFDEKARAGKAGLIMPGGRRGQPFEFVVNLHLDELMADGFPLVRVSSSDHV